MKKYADLLLESMVAHDPSVLPLAARYAATENSVAGSLNMMSAWRTVTGASQRLDLTDPRGRGPPGRNCSSWVGPFSTPASPRPKLLPTASSWRRAA